MNFRGYDRKILERNHQAQSAKEAGRHARNAYAREWRTNNLEKVRKYNEDYKAQKAERETNASA